jgi:hypothetical protein
MVLTAACISLGLSVASLAYVIFVWGTVRRIERRMTRR